MPSFVMNSNNLLSIRKSYYYLVRKGFDLEQLKNLERHEFEYYISKFNEEVEQLEEQMKQK